MRFNWFKKKLTPEAVLEILAADNETVTEEYTFSNLPIMVADDDFFEFLQEESMGNEIDINELAELFAIWMAENCDE